MKAYINKHLLFLLTLLILGSFSITLVFAERHPFLIATKELHQQANDPKLIIIDTRSASEYLKGHIPTAVNIPVERIFNDTERKDIVALLSQIQDLFQSRGINNDSRFVIFDDGPSYHAARLFRVMELYSHRDVFLLDGGIKTWLEEGLDISTSTLIPKPGNFIPTINPDRLATKYRTRLSTLNPNIVIIDTRTLELYSGNEKHPESIGSGHIPTARNKVWHNNLANNEETGRFNALDELSDLYKDVSKNEKVIAYCHQGQHSSMAYFVLRGLGYDVSVYDGSRHEWSNDLNLPLTQE
jgi:thiosulfate/3-mercaptopyruvate sulfurtransferase